MRLNSHIIYFIAAAATVLASCDANVDESERLSYVKPAEAARCVLIEDFTGQNCVNCPRATDQIEVLQKQYGADTVIAVGIHSGYFGVWDKPGQVGLRTKEGDTYYNYWNIESQPNGVIDRSDGVLQYDEWTGKVAYDLKQEAPLSISLDNSYDPESKTVTTKATVVGTDGLTTGKLQLWVIEDSIVAFQLQPDGSRKDDYVHNHVFRKSVNGTWGEDISVAEGQVVEKTYSLKLDDTWVPKHVSIVAFVYANDENGVRNVTKKKIL